MSEKIVQTAGRQQLGEFAPMFAHLNDDVLFDEVQNEAAIDVKTKCIITIVEVFFLRLTAGSLGMGSIILNIFLFCIISITKTDEEYYPNN